jgi:hypothetical protein
MATPQPSNLPRGGIHRYRTGAAGFGGRARSQGVDAGPLGVGAGPSGVDAGPLGVGAGPFGYLAGPLAERYPDVPHAPFALCRTFHSSFGLRH